MGPRDTGMDLHFGGHPFELDAILALPFQRVMPFFEHDAADLSEEIKVPIIAPKFAVSDAFKSDIFLQLHDLTDAFVLDLAQALWSDVLALPLHAGLLQFGRTQQAANMICSKRTLGVGRHGFLPSRCRRDLSRTLLPVSVPADREQQDADGSCGSILVSEDHSSSAD